MPEPFDLPPAFPAAVTPGRELAARLSSLIGTRFPLTGKSRTDGSNIRKAVWQALHTRALPPSAPDGTFRIPALKGRPRILRECLDTYIVTTGSSYNLQVWNRIPDSPSVLVEYDVGPPLLVTDIRYAFVRVDINSHVIRAIVILTPDYIAAHFGRFGKPTIKHQLIISSSARTRILQSDPPILFHPDLPTTPPTTNVAAINNDTSIHDPPGQNSVLSLEAIRRVIEAQLLGKTIPQTATKNRGQSLEELVARLLGYAARPAELLAGGYPDLRNQALETKVQDAATVDLGRYSPQFDEAVPMCPGFTTGSIRYLIALTDATTQVVSGAILCPGIRLGEHFTYVSDTNYKCQRSIPMMFFDRYDRFTVYNP